MILNQPTLAVVNGAGVFTSSSGLAPHTLRDVRDMTGSDTTGSCPDLQITPDLYSTPSTGFTQLTDQEIAAALDLPQATDSPLLLWPTYRKPQTSILLLASDRSFNTLTLPYLVNSLDWTHTSVSHGCNVYCYLSPVRTSDRPVVSDPVISLTSLSDVAPVNSRPRQLLVRLVPLSYRLR